MKPEESLRASSVLFCQEIHRAEGRDGLLSLVNVFANINIKGDVPLSVQPITLPFWIYIGAEDEKPKDRYELTIEINSPEGGQVLSVQTLLENPFLSRYISGAQNVVAVINQAGGYIVNVKFQNKIIGKSVLTIAKT